MQLKFKKIFLFVTVFVYFASFFLQSNFTLFQTRAKETNVPRVNIVAILVDSKIYDEISSDLEWYASKYVQKQFSDTKVLVLPLDLTNIHAYDIYRMMENVYFDGLKDVNSSLIGLILFGDIPLPVVNQDGYIFPTIYPYVDFEDQKYVWNEEYQYFVSNGNSQGQAEIWHGLINYGNDIQAYQKFFAKIKNYVNNPNGFVGNSIWYDDFIAQKEGFLSENLPYYRNKIMFAEDLGYQRYSPLMRNLFREEQNDNAVGIISDLEEAVNSFGNSEDLKFDGRDLLTEMSNQGAGDSHTTKVIQQEIQNGFISDYNNLFSNVYMSTMRENIFAGGRWIKEYKDSNGKKSLIVDADTSASKLQLKDEILLGDENLQGLIENLNDLMEEMVDRKISDNKYDMDIVIPVSYENEGREKFRRFLRRRCISFPTRYDNYYFGLNARNVDSAKDLSIYRGTYRNLENLSGVTYNSLEKGYNPIVGKYDSVNPKLKSIGASFDIFSNQVEGNRGYQMFSVENDLKVYDEEKKNSVVQYRREFKKKVNIKFWSDDCDKNDKNHICEDLFAFGLRWWGGASSIFVDSESISNGRYQLSGYKATDSWRSIFDMGGFQSLLPGPDEGENGRGWVDGKGKGPQKAGANFRAYIKYSSPTERAGWEDSNGTKGSSMPFVKYVNNTPDVHGMSFSDMDYWRNKYVSNDDWIMNRESSNSNIFTLALKPEKYDNTCNRYPSGMGRTIRWQKYTYKVVSSIVKHVSTTVDEINGVDRNRYGEGGILEGYYFNLKNSYYNVNKNVSDIVEELQSLESNAKNANVKGEIEKLNKKMVEILGLDRDIKQLVEKISLLEDDLENATENSDDWVREKQLELSDLDQQLSGKLYMKTNVDMEISDALTKLSWAIQKDKEILFDVYSAITSLSADEIVSSIEIIAKDEGVDPEKFYNKENNLNKVGFSQKWILEFKGIEGNIKNGIYSILNSYSNVFASINEQKNNWNKMKSVFERLSEVNSDKIELISKDMDGIFNISSLLAVDDDKATDSEDEKVQDTILTGGTAESIIKQGQYVSCPKNVAYEDDADNDDGDDSVGILGKFDGECGINKLFNWLIEEDKVGPAVVSAAKGDKDFRIWLIKNNIKFNEFSDNDWINQYDQWIKGPGYDSEGAKKNHDLLLGVSEHMSGMNLLTPDRPIDSPRYVSMQSIAGNEINFIYPDLFKVEVYVSKGKNKSGYDIHELLTGGEIKNNLVKYLKGKVYEYNKIIDEECKKAEIMMPFNDAHYVKLRDVLHYYGAVPDGSKHGCNAKFTYGEFVDSLGGEKMLDVISETLYYQSLTNKKKLSSDKIEEDIELIKQSFNLNDKRGQILKDYLTQGNEKLKNQLFEIPTYDASGYEVGFINSDGKDYIFSDDESFSSSSSSFQGRSISDATTDDLNGGVGTKQSSGQEKELSDECGIPANGKLPLFKIGAGSPWIKGFKCWLKQIKKSPVKVKLTFDSSLGEILSADSLKEYIKNSDVGQTFMDWGESMASYSDSWDTLLNPGKSYDSDMVITQMQVNAEKHNQETVGGKDGLSNALLNISNNVRITNSNVLLTDSNPSSELRIESISDVSNISVEFIGTGDGCIEINSKSLCNGNSFTTKPFNPKTNPFVGIVSSSNHVAGKVGLIIRIRVSTGYIENVIKYTVSPSVLDYVKIDVGDNGTVVGMLTPIEIIGYDKYNNKVDWGLEKYYFMVSQGRFFKDGAYVSGFSTNDFRNLRFYYQAPLEANDGSTALIQIKSSSGDVVGTYPQKIVEASPRLKINGNENTQGNLSYNLKEDESIYDGKTGKLDVSKLQKLEIDMVDKKGKIVDVDSQILVSAQNGLLVVGQVGQEDGNNVFSETSKYYMKGGQVKVYYYPTTQAGNDVISVDIPGLEKRMINISIKPSTPKKVKFNLSNDYLKLNRKTDLEIFVTDVWGNLTSTTLKLRTDPRNLKLEGLREISSSDDTVISVVDVKDGHVKIPVYGVGAGLATIEAGLGTSTSFEAVADAEFRVDADLLPETGLNIMYLNYFGNDWGNQWGYLSDNNKHIESMMKNSDKIIATTTLLVSEDKIKKVLWKIDPGFKITDFENLNTTLSIKSSRLNIGIGGLTEMQVSLPSFDWVVATLPSITTLLNNKTSTSKNYIFFIPSDVDYSIKAGKLYDSDEAILNIMNGEVSLKLSNQVLENGDNVRDVIYNGVDYGKIVFHLPGLNPKAGDFRNPGNRYMIGNVFSQGSTDFMSSIGLFDGLSEFELDTNYKSIQNSDEIDERVGFLGDFKNITLFAEGENVGEATRRYGSELLINLGDPVLSRKNVNDEVYGTNYDGGIGREIYNDAEKDIFGVYQIDFNNDGLKDWLIAYRNGVFKLEKNYGGNPDLRDMQELMRVAVSVKDVFVGDADGNGYQDIFVLTENNQIRVYLNKGGIFDVDGNVVCLNQNVFEGEKSETPSNLEGLNQFFVEDMDLDGKADIITYDEKGYIKVFYGGTTNGGSNYLSTEKYACDTGWYDRQLKNITIVTALGVQISDKDIFDNSMIHRRGMSKPAITISEGNLSKYGVNFNPNKLESLIDTNNIEGSIDKIIKEVMSSDKFNVKTASSQFIEDEAKFQEVTLYENKLVDGGDSKNYIFAPLSYLDPDCGEDLGSAWKNYSVKSGSSILQNGDIVTVTVTVKASDQSSFNGAFGDVIEGPWNVYYDEKNIIKGIRFLKNKGDAVVKSKDGNFSYIIDNIKLSKGEEMVFEYDLEYHQLPLKKMSVTYNTFWSNDDYPDIKLQSIDGCDKNFDGFVNRGKKRLFSGTLVPLQDLINKEYEDEDKMTEDYAEALGSIGGNIDNLPGLVGNKINRSSLLGNGSIQITDDEEGRNNLKNAIFSEAGISLNVDLDFFSEQTDAIENAIDDIMQGMCNGFSFGGSNNCKGLPVPFNQAFLAPGKYHLFGCWELPLGPLEKGLPVFFFPGNLGPLPFVGFLPIPYMPTGPMDSFLWVRGAGPWSSLIRIYAAPTLTAQLGIAVCLGPYSVGSALPSPFADLGGNCVVFAVKPQCKGGDSGEGSRKKDDNNPNEIYDSFIDDVKNSGVCLQSQKGSQVTGKGYRSSPFNLYSYSVVPSQGRTVFNMDVKGGSNNQTEFELNALGIINLETSAYIGVDSDTSNENNSIFIGDIDVLGGDFSINKIRGGFQQGIRQLLIDKWLDPQIRYILNQLTKMHINIKLPDLAGLIDNEVQTINYVGENIGNIWKNDSTKGGEEVGTSGSSKWRNINYDSLTQLNKSISNPFEALASLMNESNIINISVEPITVKIPMITEDDINGYQIYLQQRLEVNGGIINRWRYVLSADDFELKMKDFEKLQNQIYANLMTLQKYRNFPFELYEWVHVIDRYMAEIAALINNTIGYLSYWVSTNSQRFVGYVDAIVLMLNIIKTYQLLIDLSVEWGQNCGNCSKDTYDQYSCKLSFLCNMIQLPIIQIPNFKLPNITLDLSNIDLGLDIILPSFQFQPVKVQLPELPNLPEPPSFSVNIELNLPNMPMLPEPPELPELPSFIPEIEIELPVLPPAPELPKLPSQIEGIITAAKLIGKIYCIVKGKFGLVGESSVKAKIEQLTQRTYEVKWIDTIMNFTNFSVAPIHNYGLDYEISSYLDLQFNFSTFYDYLDALTRQINGLTTSAVNFVNDQANDLVNNNPLVEFTESVDGATFGVDAKIGMANSIPDVDVKGLESDDVEYVDYDTAKARLREVLAYFRKEINDITARDSYYMSLNNIENQISKKNSVTRNEAGIENVKNEVIAYLDEKKTDYDDLANLINNDYDGFLAMVDSQYTLNDKTSSETGQLLTFNVQLFNVDSSTKDVINTITKTNPYDTILNNKKSIIDGYWNAINSNSANDLGLSQSQYLVLRDSISSMRNQITTLYSVTKPVSLTNLVARNSLQSTDKVLLSSTAGGNRLGSNIEVANVVDPSVLSEGIYDKIVRGADNGKMTKIVFADSFASVIGDRYYHTSHKDGDPRDDVVLWDDGSVYLKCKGGVCGNGNGGYTKYYESEIIWQIPYEETWIKFDGSTELKISDVNREVKNWNVVGQSYDDLSLSWNVEEDVDAYLIKLVVRVDNSYEKLDFSATTPVRYVLALPEGITMDDLYSGGAKLELLRKAGRIKDLHGKDKDLVQIVNYDVNQDVADVVISDIDRKWYYARIATLNIDDNVYKVNSPRSNQIVVGKQIVGDDLAPEGEAVLYRPTTKQNVSQGDNLDGYVGTKYKLIVNWEDNVALSYINLSQNGKLLDEKYTSMTGDSVSTNIDFHTKVENETFYTVGVDQFGNKTEKMITVSYSVPEIKITDISKNSDGKSVAITAELSQDLDKGNVSFQRNRGNAWKTIVPNGKDMNLILTKGKTKIVGFPYSIGKDVALYDKNGEVMALLDPDTARITFKSGYENNFEVSVNVQNGSIFQVINKKTGNSVFSISIPAETCLKYEMDNYKIVDLPENGKMGVFNGGKVIYSKEGDNVLYISPKCYLYSELGMEGTYDYDRELDAVVLKLYWNSDWKKQYPIKIWFKARPLMNN